MKRYCWPLPALGAMLILFGVACKSGGSVADFSTIEVNPAVALVEVDVGTVAIGGFLDYTFLVTNTGKNKDLRISAIRLELDYTPTSMESADPEGRAFQLLTLPAIPATVTPTGMARSDAPDTIAFSVRYRKFDDDLPRKARVIIENDNSSDFTRRSLVITFQTVRKSAVLSVPATLDFGQVHAGEAPEREITLQNIGSSDLYIDWFNFQGGVFFTLNAGEIQMNGDQTRNNVPLDPPLLIEAGKGVVWTMAFAPENDAPAQAKLVIHPTNDPDAPEGRQVEILGNTNGPRLCVEPNPVEFGGKVIMSAARINVRMTSCGTTPLTITDISLVDSSPDFEILFDQLPGGVGPTAAAPLNIAPNAFETLAVQFTPDQKNPADPGTGKPIADVGTIVIASNSFTDRTQVEVTGFGVDAECPQPVIAIEEGEEVEPQTVLHLHGEQSQASTGGIISYGWTVQQPPDNMFNLQPSNDYQSPTHQANVAGEYQYCLDVCDALHCSSDPDCNTTVCKTVTVVPQQAIHVELTWSTPGDPDPFNEGPDAGADMDLHFTHPFATGPDLDQDGAPDGWFDMSWDCFWYRPRPEWESVNPNVHDDPRLDRDDTDGAGPENVNLDVPVQGRVYRIGVHYWDSHNYGYSYPRVKIYIWGTLVYDRNLESEDRKMSECDLWEVATITWDVLPVIEEIKRPDGSPKITKAYQNPAFATFAGGNCTPE